MLLEEEMLKDEVVLGLQAKREEHIGNIQKKYDRISAEDCRKSQ
jgi:hypothetical protein